MSFYQRFRERGFSVIGISGGDLFGGDDAFRVSEFVQQTGVRFPVGFDRSESYRAYRSGVGVSPFPLDVILDGQGKIAYINREYDPGQMETVIEDLLTQAGR